MGLTAVAILLGGTVVGSEIRPDEFVQFYPSYAYQNPDGRSWTVTVHGTVFEPEDNSIRRAVAIRLIRRAIPVEITGDQKALFERRVRGFLVDDERGKTVTIRLADRRFDLDTSDSNGSIESTFTWQPSAKAYRQIQQAPGGWLAYDVVTPHGDDRRFFGWVQFVGDRGLSVVSDIDDTIKDSQVLNRDELLTNTFLRPFRAVSGMAALYRSAARRGVVFHYVSGSPWQLYKPLGEFVEEHAFPVGSIHLRKFDLSASSLAALSSAPEETKFTAIRPLLKAFPGRRFVLIGDSGERDPEIYGQLAREHRGQIAGIFIRRVDEANNDPNRFLTAFEGLDPRLWRVFRQSRELEDPLHQLVRTYVAERD